MLSMELWARACDKKSWPSTVALYVITAHMLILHGERWEAVSACLQWRRRGWWGGSCSEVSPVPSPLSPFLTPLSPLPALSLALRPAAQTKPRVFALCPPSLQIPVVCWRLALGDNREREGDRGRLLWLLANCVCLSVNGAFFISLSFSLPRFLLLPRQSCVFKMQHPLLPFPVTQTARERGETCYI